MEWIDNQINIHDGFAQPEYGNDTWQASKLKVFESYLAALTPKPKTLVDLGCFNGSLSGRFFPFAERVIGIDVHAQALAEAQKKGIETICFDVASGQQCPLPDGCADVIICADVIEHVIDPRNLMNEAKRLLKPSGTMLLSTPNLGYWLSRIRLAVGRAPMCTNGVAPGFRSDHWVDPSHMHVCLLDEWLAFFADCGWQVHEVRGSHLQFGGRRRMAAHLMDRICDKYFPSLTLVPVIRLSPARG